MVKLPNIQNVVLIPVMVGLLGLFVAGSRYYSTTMDRILEHPLVTEVKAEELETRFQIGSGAPCGEVDCWIKPGFDDRSWAAIRMPKEPLLPRFEGADPDQAAYYRFRVRVPAALRASSEEIAFSPSWIAHRWYEIYVNGRLVLTGNGMDEQGDVIYQKVNIPLPRAFLGRDDVAVAIKGSVKPGDQGIHHFGKMMIGPATELARLYMQAEHSMGSYYLLFLVGKGSIFLVFALFALLARTRPGFGFFVAFAFAGTIENLAIGNFIEGFPFGWRVACYFGLKACAATALLGFYLSFAKVPRRVLAVTFFGLVAVSLAVGFGLDFGFGGKWLSVPQQHVVSNVTLSSVVVLGLLAVLWARRQATTGKNPGIRGLRVMTWTTSLYTVALGWAFFGKPYAGYDSRPVIDLLFFYVVAYLSVTEFGLAQLRVAVLEHGSNRLNAVLARFLGKDLKDRLLAGENLLAEREMTIMIVEARNFRDIARCYEGPKVLDLLSGLHMVVTEIVTARGGHIERLNGPQIRVTWGHQGNPRPAPGQAVLAALDLRQALRAWSEERRASGGIPIEAVVGIAQGDCLAGVVGTATRQEHAVLGAPVDQALDLVLSAKEAGVDVMMAPKIFEASLDFVVAEGVTGGTASDFDAVSGYKLIGAFDGSGQLVIHSTLWQQRFGHLTEAGLVQDAGANIERIDFRLRLVS